MNETMTGEAHTVVRDPQFKVEAVQILHGATWSALGIAIGMVLEYLTQGLVAAWLGPSDFGTLSVGLQIFLFSLVVAGLALPSAVSYFVPNAREEERAGWVGRIVSTSLLLSFVASLLAGALLFVAAPFIGEQVFHKPELVAVLRLLALALPGSTLLTVVTGILRGLKLSRQASLLTSTYDRALRLGFIVVFLVAGMGLKAPALAYLPASLLVVAIGLVQVWRARVAPRLVSPALDVATQMFHYSLPLLASQLLLQIKAATQPLLLAFFLDTRSAGLFAVGSLISGAFAMVLVAFNFLYLPVVSGLSIEEHRARIRRLYRMVTGWVITISLPVALLVIAVPEAFLALFGGQYTAGAAALRILVLGAVANVAVGAVGTTLLATGKTGTYLKLSVVGVGLGFGMSVILVPTFELVGAATAHMLSSVVWNGLSLWVLYRLYRMQPFSRQYLYVFVVSTVSLLLLLPGIRWVVDLSHWAILALTPAYLGLVLALLWIFGLLDGETRATVTLVLGRLRNKPSPAQARPSAHGRKHQKNDQHHRDWKRGREPMRSKSIDARQPHAVIVGLDSLQGLQTARILARHRVPVIGIARNRDAFYCRTNVCDRILYTDTKGDELVHALETLGPELGQKAVLVPSTDMSVLIVSRNRKALSPWYHILLPEHDIVEMLLDKSTFYTYAQQEGLPVPKTFLLHNEADARAAAGSLTYPCMLKPSTKTPLWEKHAAGSVYKVSSSEEFLELYQRASQWADLLLAQEVIVGGEDNHYTVNCYFPSDTQPIVSFVSRKLRQWPVETGNASIRVEARNDAVLRETLRLFKSVDYRGLGYAEMKRDERTGEHFFIEANIGRPTGGAAVAEAGGVDLIYAMYCDAAGRPLPANLEQTYGGVKWIFMGEDIQSAYHHWRRGELSLADWWRSLRGPKAYAVISWQDPGPALGHLWIAVKRAAVFVAGRWRRRVKKHRTDNYPGKEEQQHETI